MKTLAKILCTLAVGLFISLSVNAQNMEDADFDTDANIIPETAVEGHVGCNIPPYLRMCVLDPAVHFQFSIFEPSLNHLEETSEIGVVGNVDWKVTINTEATVLTDKIGLVETMPIETVELWVDDPGAEAREALSLSGYDFTGGPRVMADGPYTVNWYFVGTENYYAGTYEAPIAFTVSQN